MIQTISIENYKSIQALTLDLGRVTVLIGENGSGKSNILEAVALGSAAANMKLDNEFLVSRGIRVTEPSLMRSAFIKESVVNEIKISLLENDDLKFDCVLQNANTPYSKWIDSKWTDKIFIPFDRQKDMENFIAENPTGYEPTLRQQFYKAHFDQTLEKLHLPDFLIYSPENPALRTFEREGQIQPLGINGEGLFKLLWVLNQEAGQEKIGEIKEKLHLIDWFDDFDIPNDLFAGERRLQIKDRYLDPDLAYFDQKSSNEGFLFLLFYFTLFISDETPQFFAIDNIDASLNPKLCSRLMTDLAALAKKHDKQVILTTHNPAVLDGLNVDDDEQRLFVIYRNKLGHTKARRIEKPKPLEGQDPVKLSEAFMRGYIGGLPKNF